VPTIRLPNTPSQSIKKRLEPVVKAAFSRQEFHQCNMRDIAKKAGVGYGTIYKYYGSKEKILFTFVDEWLGELAGRIIDHLQGLEEIKEKLRKAFWVQLDYYERNPDLGRIILMTIPLTTWMADQTFVQKKMTDTFLEVFREGQGNDSLNPNVPASIMLDMMLAMVGRAFTMWIYRGQKQRLSGQANLLFNLIWKAIST